MSGRYHKKIGDIVEGESRVFINIKKNGQTMSIGLPKPENSNRNVYLRNQGKSQYVSPGEGRQLLSQVNARLLGGSSGAKSIGSCSGSCNNCGKTLRGNTQKPLCYSCWKGSN